MTQTELRAGSASSQPIYDALRECLIQVVGGDVVALMEVNPQTKIFTELGLTSIDMVRLAELIGQRYPVGDSLVLWIADRPLRVLARLTVADVVEFIAHARR